VKKLAEMTNKFLIKVLYASLCLISGFNAYGQQAGLFGQPELSQSTVIDLRLNQWGLGNSYSLEGDWAFSWEKFTHKKDDLLENSWSTVRVPGSWLQDSSEQLGLEKLRSAKGYGTYYKQILVPQHINKVYIYLPDMASAYELWNNGVLLGGNGIIAINKADEKPAYLPRVYEFTPINGKIEVFIKTSNYHYQWGGIWYAPKITDESGVHSIRDIPILKATTSGTILLASGIFCLLIFLSRPQDKKILYFSLFCFAIGIRRLTMDERVLYLINRFEWQTLQATENITMYLMLPLFLSYFQSIFPQTTPKKLTWLGWLTAIPFCFAVLLLDVETYSGLNPYFQIVLLLFVPFILYCWAKAFKRKLKNAKAFGLSLFVFLFAIVNDMLNYSYVINTTNLTHMGVLAFVLFQLGGLVKRYLSNFKSIESLSKTLQEQNQALIKLDEFKDDFLASTSHELRMPLHGIAGLAKTIKHESPNLSAGAQNRINLIEATAKRLGNLVNDILDMSSMKHDKLSIQVMPSYLSPLIDSTIQSLSPLIKNKPITLDFHVDADANHVLADEQRLQQILYNLIGNAIKFTERGFIHIKASRQNNYVKIEVSDSGIGISLDQLSKVLMPFETIDNLASNDIRGTGLGLAISRMLVELHQGKLKLRSIEGEGTTAEFTLPWVALKSVDEAKTSTNDRTEQEAKHFEVEVLSTKRLSVDSRDSTPSQHKNDQSSLTKNALIFYADDEEVNRELVTSQLVEAGYLIEVFPDGEALLEKLPHSAPELILLDWMMPGKNGLEVCTEIRQQYDAYHLPIIMLTARHQIHDIVQALNAGANDYLTKPYHEQELTARVYSQVSVKRLMLASIENEQLKNEIQHQKRQKQQLNSSNLRLAEALDASQENIILLNEDLDIVFANVGAKALMAVEGEKWDLEINQYIDEVSVNQLKMHLNSNQMQSELTLLLKAENKAFSTTIQTTDIENERFLSLIMHSANHQMSVNKTESTQGLLSKLTHELAENRQRMELIELTLGKLSDEETSMLPMLSIDQESDDPKELIVNVLRTALISWERYTHKTKANLAEESHCWRVYIDGATAKTRTLDKYLSVKTLPAKPRWRSVIKTANYVLDHCEMSEEDQYELEGLIQRVTLAYA
jgi:signal transduction histidine kinase/DNA-binding response OmpR family regulator